MRGRLMRLLSRLRGDTSGVAMLEFALVTPVFTGLLLYGVETAHYISVHQQVSRMAITAADLTARYRNGADETDMVEVVAGAVSAARNLNFEARGRIIISSISLNAASNPPAATTTGHWVRWQRCAGNMTSVQSKIGVQNAGQSDNSIAFIQSDTNKGNIVVPKDGNVILAEVYYDYQPLFFSDFMTSNRRMRYSAVTMPREQNLFALTNSTSWPTTLTCA